MDPLADYPHPVLGFNPIRNMVITGTNRILCYGQIIYDDNRVEDDELFSLTLVVRDQSTVTTQVDQQRSSTLVKIINDDGELHLLQICIK